MEKRVGALLIILVISLGLNLLTFLAVQGARGDSADVASRLVALERENEGLRIRVDRAEDDVLRALELAAKAKRDLESWWAIEAGKLLRLFEEKLKRLLDSFEDELKEKKNAETRTDS